ncbi:hypothetical protein [Sinorhizobium psoraleae]|uniref:Phage gp6-like head-tail connector protein n=1 Tax=Sinorhizobium psoraleae TaxID=520838 RepID=A0ABT4KI74_9HYPH|nr:hypothetical protein [Sinorhizobium psoraleae]MCZ4091669.1 hypothetical protein [Sinorhizobium psoraleae]
MDDLPTLQALVAAHKASMDRYDSSPDEEIPDDIVAEMMTTGAALCAYRPATIESVHIKAKYMMTCFVFVGGDEGDPDFTHAQLVSGFLPAGEKREA